MSDWAKLSLSHSERDVHRTIKKQGLTLEVPLRCVLIGSEQIPWIPPSTWLKYIIDQNLWHHFTGLTENDPAKCNRVWCGYWQKFQKLYPDFQLPCGFNPAFTMACYVHGDEGRTLKKSPLMVMSLQSTIGYGLQTSKKRPREHDADEDLFKVNYIGHTFKTRLVMSILPKKWTDDFYDEVADRIVQDLKDVLSSGYTDPRTGIRYNICVVGVKGDWPFLIKAARLNRHFCKGTKKAGLEWKASGICHLCMAGTQMNGVHYAYEEAGYMDPAWLRTIPAPPPWTTVPPYIQHLPHRRSDAATYFEPDIWHTMHLGVGKCFAGSCIVLALATLPMLQGMVMNEKWNVISSHYLRWCKQNRKPAYLTKIGPSTVNYGDATGAQGTWNKGMVTTNVLLWLQDLLAGPFQNNLLLKAQGAATTINAMFRCMYAAGLFLPAEESKLCGSLGRLFIRNYCDLAELCYKQCKPYLFPLLPKIHSIDHLVMRVLQQGEAHGFSINPIATACQMDEDAIGRVSRISRRVSSRTVVERTFRRYLASCYAIWFEAGLLPRS